MNDFSVHRIIGRGGFGEVYGCRKADTGKMSVYLRSFFCDVYAVEFLLEVMLLYALWLPASYVACWPFCFTAVV